MDEFLSAVLAQLRHRRCVMRDVLRLREGRGIHELRRGEVYEEIIAAERAFRRAAVAVYGLGDHSRVEYAVQPNFGANGCIDSIFSFVREEEVSRFVSRSSVGGMLIVLPTYPRYLDVAEAKGIETRTVRSLDDAYPIDAVLDAIRSRPPSVLVVISPNNPTGTVATKDHYLLLRKALPPESLLLIDRTCASTVDNLSTVDLIRSLSGTRSIIVHSLSKYLHLAHLRFGFALFCDPELGWRMRHHAPLGSELEGALLATEALESAGPIVPLPDVLETIRESAKEITALCQSTRFSTPGVTGNFALLRCPPGVSAQATCEALARDGIFVIGSHEFRGEGDDWIRVHVASRIGALVERLRVIGG